MGKKISRRSFLVLAMSAAAMGVTGLAGCGGSSGSSGASAGGSSDAVKIGTMPTEDILPMWVAEQEGLFDAHDVGAEVVVFDSAQNLSAAITAGEVDLAMTDPMRAAKLAESGTELTMEWITLGTTAAQGRFGVLTSADSGYKTLKSLLKAEQGVGLGANTVPEYVFDKLCEEAGVDPAKVRTQEVASLPDRYSLVAQGQLDAAALPGSMLALGEAAGMRVIADDSKGKNLSQSVMIARAEFKDGNAEGLDAVRAAWDDAAKLINEKPEEYRELLVEKANLNSKVADDYPISEYPLATASDGGSAYPPAKLIEPQLAWMKQKGYSEKDVTYNEADGSFTIA